jgi:hypothetical protein
LNITVAHHVNARNSVFNHVGGSQINNIANRMTTINIVVDCDSDGYEMSQEIRPVDHQPGTSTIDLVLLWFDELHKVVWGGGFQSSKCDIALIPYCPDSLPMARS